MKQTRKWWLGFISIFILYTFYHILMIDFGFNSRVGAWWRHVIKFSTATIIFILGTFFLKNAIQPMRWMWQLWNLVHISGILLLITFGALDHWIVELNNTWRYFASRIHLFLISPIFYVAMGLLSKQLDIHSSDSD